MPLQYEELKAGRKAEVEARTRRPKVEAVTPEQLLTWEETYAQHAALLKVAETDDERDRHTSAMTELEELVVAGRKTVRRGKRADPPLSPDGPDTPPRTESERRLLA